MYFLASFFIQKRYNYKNDTFRNLLEPSRFIASSSKIGLCRWAISIFFIIKRLFLRPPPSISLFLALFILKTGSNVFQPVERIKV
jgi:hypothetical protein